MVSSTALVKKGLNSKLDVDAKDPFVETVVTAAGILLIDDD